ncbi:MAG: DsbE family thiol:disulfide interchange protein [Gammaproteobacteria bacterium]|nr:DsbE family thiol:disulfide interchange protein [Gammaproteobacteria bacterium]
MNRAKLFVPATLFGVLVIVLYLGFTLRDPTLLPSALLDKPFPGFDLPVLAGAPGERATRDRLLGETRLVNVWATWCPTCLAEHGELMRIRAETGLSIVGISYKDDSRKARQWLAHYGDPYDFNVVDLDGDLGVDLGVYGAPETFLVDAEGIIRFKHVGDVNPGVWRDEFEPRIAALKGKDEVAENRL